jgi:hypothetical protein
MPESFAAAGYLGADADPDLAGSAQHVARPDDEAGRENMAPARKRTFALLAVIAAALVLVGYTHDVPTTLTEADRAAASMLMRRYHIPEHPVGFQQQLHTISAIQRAILDVTPVTQPIAKDQPRNLPDLIRAGHGFCFDRSRGIETMLRASGFKVRHVSIYSTAGRSWGISALFARDTASHALTEVLTDKGWMAVGSNWPWIGLTKDGRTIDLSDLRKVNLADLRTQPGDFVMRSQHYKIVYGLYSRHGHFYAPYDPIPDVDWGEMLYNLTF